MARDAYAAQVALLVRALPLVADEHEFGLIGHPAAAELPAIRWKLLNLRKLRDSNPEKHADQRARLAAALC